MLTNQVGMHLLFMERFIGKGKLMLTVVPLSQCCFVFLFLRIKTADSNSSEKSAPEPMI